MLQAAGTGLTDFEKLIEKVNDFPNETGESVFVAHVRTIFKLKAANVTFSVAVGITVSFLRNCFG